MRDNYEGEEGTGVTAFTTLVKYPDDYRIVLIISTHSPPSSASFNPNYGRTEQRRGLR
jgi:hypothetical protein